jgi:hypothetical protein
MGAARDQEPQTHNPVSQRLFSVASSGGSDNAYRRMARTSRSNLPQDVPLKWNVEKAAVEFGVSIMTLRKSLAKTSAEPNPDGLFTTRQIAGAVYGGALSEEKLRTQRQLTRKLELDNAITEASVLDRAELQRVFAAIADAFVSRVMSVQGLSRQEKEDLLKDLSSWPLVLQGVARSQTRLPRGNGTHPESEGEER